MKKLHLVVVCWLICSLACAQENVGNMRFELSSVTRSSVDSIRDAAKRLYVDSTIQGCVQHIELLSIENKVVILFRINDIWRISNTTIPAEGSQFRASANFNVRGECELLVTRLAEQGEQEVYWLVNLDMRYIKRYENMSEVILRSTGW